MSKRLLFAGALAAFVTLSGMPSLITNLIISKSRHSVVHASNSLDQRQNHSAFKSPATDVANNVNSFISQASFATLNAGSPKAQMLHHDNAGALQYDTLVVKEEIDLGEIFIDGVK